jgi:hypothetical protein
MMLLLHYLDKGIETYMCMGSPCAYFVLDIIYATFDSFLSICVCILITCLSFVVQSHRTALTNASLKGHTAIVELLRAAGAH